MVMFVLLILACVVGGSLGALVLDRLANGDWAWSWDWHEFYREAGMNEDEWEREHYG
jgi:hypothetical protein